MVYSIKFGANGTNTIWLDKHIDDSEKPYVVCDLDMKDNKHTFSERFYNFDDADKRFLALCAENGMEPQNVINE